MARDDDDPNRIVTLQLVHDPVRAEVIKDLLAQEGIEAIVPGAKSGGGVLVGAAVGALDIPIRVRAADADAARAIVAAMDDFDAVLPDGEGGPAVPADEMLRRLERLDAEDEGEGPYRAAPIAGARETETPRLARIAIPAAVIIPFGGGHFYARDTRGGLALALTQVLMLSIAWSGDPLAWWGFLLGMAADAFGAVTAVERFNSRRAPSGPRDYVAAIASVALIGVFAVPWLLARL